MSLPSRHDSNGQHSGARHPYITVPDSREQESSPSEGPVPTSPYAEAVENLAAQLHNVNISNHYEKAVLRDNARGILGNVYHTHQHVYSAGPPGPIDIDASTTAKLLHTILAAVDEYKKVQIEGMSAAAAEELSAVIAETLSAPSSRADVAEVGGAAVWCAGSPGASRGGARMQVDDWSTLAQVSDEPEVAQQDAPPDRTADLDRMTSTRTLMIDAKQLSTCYQRRTGKFFVPGRVFAMLWPEAIAASVNATNRHSGTVTDGPYGEKIFSHIRRFVVVRSRQGSSWCVALATYGGRGLLQRALSRTEIAAHAIIYDSKSEPKSLNGEPRTRHRPIAVNMALNQTLSTESRVHLGKPYNVESNCRVLDIGKVCEEDLKSFVSAVEQELLGY